VEEASRRGGANYLIPLSPTPRAALGAESASLALTRRFPSRLVLTAEQTDLYVVHWFGFGFDLTVGFFMLFPGTRPAAMLFCAAFHLMNSRLFSIGAPPVEELAQRHPGEACARTGEYIVERGFLQFLCPFLPVRRHVPVRLPGHNAALLSPRLAPEAGSAPAIPAPGGCGLGLPKACGRARAKDAGPALSIRAAEPRPRGPATPRPPTALPALLALRHEGATLPCLGCASPICLPAPLPRCPQSTAPRHVSLPLMDRQTRFYDSPDPPTSPPFVFRAYHPLLLAHRIPMALNSEYVSRIFTFFSFYFIRPVNFT
jgi:hypothetical protein